MTQTLLRVVVFSSIATVTLRTTAAQGTASVPSSSSAARPSVPSAREPTSPKQTAARPTPTQPDYKVVFWFGRSDWKHQVYDVRKGQYTPAVDAWVNQVEVDRWGYVMPGRMATVRDVYLKNEQGKTEQEKLQSAIRREQAKILGKGPAIVSSGRISERLGRPLPLVGGPTRLPGADLLDLGRRPGMNRPTDLSPPGYRFPVPYPYPRPHP